MRSARRALLTIGLLALAGCGGDTPRTVESAASSTTSVQVAASTTAPAAPDTTAPVAPSEGPASTTTARRSAPTTAARSSPTTAAQPSNEQPPPRSPDTTAATTTTTSSPGGAAITIQNFTFNPPLLNVAAGTAVTATNRDSAPHTWTADDGSWDSGNLGQGDAFTRTFSTAGTFGYHCRIHPSMKGSVRVA